MGSSFPNICFVPMACLDIHAYSKVMCICEEERMLILKHHLFLFGGRKNPFGNMETSLPGFGHLSVLPQRCRFRANPQPWHASKFLYSLLRSN